MTNQVLLDNVDTNTTSGNYVSRGGPIIVIVRGDDYGSGTVNVQMASGNDTGHGGGSPRFATLTDGDFTADGQVKVDYCPVGALIRADLVGSTNPDDVYVEVLQ